LIQYETIPCSCDLYTREVMEHTKVLQRKSSKSVVTATCEEDVTMISSTYTNRYYWYLGTRVPSVQSLTSTALAGHTPSPRSRSGPNQTWGPGPPCGKCPNTESPLKSLAQSASKASPNEGVTWSNRMWPHLPHISHAAWVQHR
jgi:hypothetical protein